MNNHKQNSKLVDRLLAKPKKLAKLVSCVPSAVKLRARTRFHNTGRRIRNRMDGFNMTVYVGAGVSVQDLGGQCD